MFQPVVVGVWRPLAPGQPIRRQRRFDGRCSVARIALDLAQHVAGIGVEERVRPALGGIPDLVEQLAGLLWLTLLQCQFRQRNQGGQFFLHEVDFAGAFEGVVQALLGELVLPQPQRGLPLAAGRADKVCFVASMMRLLPGALSVCQGFGGLVQPEVVLGEEGV